MCTPLLLLTEGPAPEAIWPSKRTQPLVTVSRHFHKSPQRLSKRIKMVSILSVRLFPNNNLTEMLRFLAKA